MTDSLGRVSISVTEFNIHGETTGFSVEPYSLLF